MADIDQSTEKISALQEGLMEWSEDNLRGFPWRNTDSTYEVLIAEILLQRTDANKVEPVYRKFVETYPGFDKLAEAEVDDVASVLEPLGLQNKRGKALVRIAKAYLGKQSLRTRKS